MKKFGVVSLRSLTLAATAFLSTHAIAYSSQQARQALQSFYDSNPLEMSVGVSHVERYSIDPSQAEPFIVSVVVPALHPEVHSTLADLNTRSPNDLWPDRFVMTDGDTDAQMVVVDQSPGSALSLQIDTFIEDMESRGVSTSDPGEVVNELRDHTEDYFNTSKANLFRGYRTEILQKKRVSLSAEARKVFEDFKNKPISGNVWLTPDMRPTLPFEYYLAHPSQTLCFHNSLLASLILQRLGIPHNMRAGFTSDFKPPYSTTGHTIILLADGRILDPTWNFVKRIKSRSDHSDWISGSTWWWKPYAHFPFLILE
ncbi:MAG: hypothetical protein ABIR96_01465 [Bdellovibrionota bacterium]